ncbi:MAG: hypothetical protein NTW74_15785 [Acidobacteria bacterium]|nr:hypothetical protein [Acidobacteriota bacterium]
MQLLPTEEEIVELLRETGALRTGNFVYPDGSYTDEYLGLTLVMSYYKNANILSVA